MTTTPTGVLITGGASGIGLATALACAEAGRPVAIWDLGRERVEQAAAAVAAHGVAAVGIAIDVTDHDAVPAAVERTHDALGSIGGFVHSAGISGAQPIDGIDWSVWQQVIDIHLNAYGRIAAALVPHLTARPGGAIVGISSINGIIGNGANPAYNAAKSGIIGLTRSLAHGLGPRGVRANAVSPGYIVTPMTAASRSSDTLVERWIASTPLGRLGQPEEIGRVARFLLSDEASFLTGQVIAVDGGVTTTV